MERLLRLAMRLLLAGSLLILLGYSFELVKLFFYCLGLTFYCFVYLSIIAFYLLEFCLNLEGDFDRQRFREDFQEAVQAIANLNEMYAEVEYFCSCFANLLGELLARFQ